MGWGTERILLPQLEVTFILNLLTFFNFVRGQNHALRPRHQSWKLGRKQVFYYQQTNWDGKWLQGFFGASLEMVAVNLETQSICSLFFSIYRWGKTSLLFPLRKMPAVTLGGSWRQSDTMQSKVSFGQTVWSRSSGILHWSNSKRNFLRWKYSLYTWPFLNQYQSCQQMNLLSLWVMQIKRQRRFSCDFILAILEYLNFSRTASWWQTI